MVASCLAYAGKIRLESLGVPNLDFYGHLVFMGLLAFFADGLLGHRVVFPRRPTLRTVRLGPALVLAAAATDEVLQRFSSHRSSTWSDFAADVIGVTLATLVAMKVAGAIKERGCRAPAA